MRVRASKNMLVVDDLTQRLIPSKHALFVDAVFKSRETQGIWPTIDLLVKQWVESRPKEYDSFVVSTEEKRGSRANKYGSNSSKTIRETVDFPQPIHDRIRTIYKADELPFDKEFFRQVWKRYPQFRVASTY